MLDTKYRRPTSTIHHKKHTGAHQKHTKPFMKTYWPYLPLFGIAGLLVIVMGSRVLGPTGAVMGTLSVLLAGVSFLV